MDSTFCGGLSDSRKEFEFEWRPHETWPCRDTGKEESGWIEVAVPEPHGARRLVASCAHRELSTGKQEHALHCGTDEDLKNTFFWVVVVVWSCFCCLAGWVLSQQQQQHATTSKQATSSSSSRRLCSPAALQTCFLFYLI